MLRQLPMTALLVLQPFFGHADPLSVLNLDRDATTVSGLSSGAFLAVQIQVAFSQRVVGAGVVAGGPYGCSDGSVFRAIRVCMNAFWGEADAEAALETIQELSEAGQIDDVSHLTADQVYLFHGEADDTVARASMDAVRQTFALLNVPADQIFYETEIKAGHGFVTEDGSLECNITRPDFLIDCDIDQAGDILNQLYADLLLPKEPRDEGLMSFDQAEYLGGAVGMDDTAFVYVPEACTAGALCRLHIALHGCQQGRERIGDAYAVLTGYNRWAEANRIVLLYPQALTILAPWWNWFGGNPNGC
ncbi:hypothetical protein [uncultured Roseobacter sp.]|uniref:extracellular catalytic domain type 2 short-chain-length polyhydroxyalkanoate depolymerase n=1 Tax=uncultured Roseobacter sp. TaxID=114847 RepID=UPI00261726AD|nr:hypothetical protein [uncultured Roseobacter sp.]